MAEKIITDVVFKKSVAEMAQLISDNSYDFVPYENDEIDSLFSLTPEESQKLTDLIADTVISKYKLWSSKKVNDELTSAKSECNDYTDLMLSNISSITIEYVDALPSTGDSSTIYILKAADGLSKDTLNLYNATNGWTVIGDFEIKIEDYYKKTELDAKLDLKADKTEIFSQDDVIDDTSLASTSNVLSATTTLNELDKKIDKTSIATIIGDTPSDEKVVSEKLLYEQIQKSSKVILPTTEPTDKPVGTIWLV